MEKKGGAYRVVVGRPDGKRPHGRPRLKWIFNKLYGEECTGLL